MANLNKAISKNLFDNILPTFGNPRACTPIWDCSQKMFICDEYESANGNRYYKGVRFCNRVAVVEKVGLYHNWTYIDGIELYAFNGKKLELIQKRDYDKVFRNEDFVRMETQGMMRDFLAGVLKTQNMHMDSENIDAEAKRLTESCYKNFLDKDYSTMLTQQILPAIEQKQA